MEFAGPAGDPGWFGPGQRRMARPLAYGGADLRAAVRGLHGTSRPVDLLDGHAPLAAGGTRRGRRSAHHGSSPTGAQCASAIRSRSSSAPPTVDRDRRAARHDRARDAPHHQGDTTRRGHLRRRRPRLATLELCDGRVGAGYGARDIPSKTVARQEDRPLLRRIRAHGARPTEAKICRRPRPRRWTASSPICRGWR